MERQSDVVSDLLRPPDDDELRRMADDTTEIGIAAEDIFLNAATGLFEPDNVGALRAVMSAQKCKQMHDAVHRRLLELLMAGGHSTEDIRWILELQRVAAEFLRMTECARSVAHYAVALGGQGQWYLENVAGLSIELLGRMVQQTRVEIRGAVVVCASRDREKAHLLLQEDSRLERMHTFYSEHLDEAISYDMRNAVRLQQLLYIGMQMREIGLHATAVCDAVLFDPPPRAYQGYH